MRQAGPLPLLWFGLFRHRANLTQQRFNDERGPGSETSHWETSLADTDYASVVNTIRELIAAGDTYQVNFTMRRHFTLAGTSETFFTDLCRAQPTPYSAYIDNGRFQIVSASPELFFSLKDRILTTRPMKGTAARGRWWQEDEEAKQGLMENDKERGENVMIVDLLRSDMGRVSVTGSVQVTSLFEVETLPTVHQMTSTIQSRDQE